MDIQQRIHHQRVRHIIDSYMLMGTGTEAVRFDAYVDDLLKRYPSGLIELALVETLAQSWLSVPMQRGLAFLTAAHACLNQWQAEPQAEMVAISVTPSQFSQITGLDPQIAFAALIHPGEGQGEIPGKISGEMPSEMPSEMPRNEPTALPTQAAIEP